MHEVKLLEYNQPVFTIQATVSSGAYVRSLVNDIAQQAGSYASTYELERTAIGPFTLDKAHALKTFSSEDDIIQHLIPVATTLGQLTNYTHW